LRDTRGLRAACAISQPRGQFHRLQQLDLAHVPAGWAAPTLTQIEVGLADDS
jgi:hypothetical protein